MRLLTLNGCRYGSLAVWTGTLFLVLSRISRKDNWPDSPRSSRQRAPLPVQSIPPLLGRPPPPSTPQRGRAGLQNGAYRRCAENPRKMERGTTMENPWKIYLCRLQAATRTLHTAAHPAQQMHNRGKVIKFHWKFVLKWRFWAEEGPDLSLPLKKFYNPPPPTWHGKLMDKIHFYKIMNL